MINIAICDDDVGDLEKIKEMLGKWQIQHDRQLRLSAYESGTALLHAIQDGAAYDLFILDILMPDMNGIELGLKLREELKSNIGGNKSSSGSGSFDKTASYVPIIYLTSSPEFAIESYEVRAFFYMLKPVSYGKIDAVLTEAVGILERSASASITVRTKSGTFSVSYDEICYLELSKRSVHYVCRDRELYSVTVQGSFKEYTAPLAGDERFFMCGASILVNMECISSIEKNDVTFVGGLSLHIPRGSGKSLYTAWLDYWLEDDPKRKEPINDFPHGI